MTFDREKFEESKLEYVNQIHRDTNFKKTGLYFTEQSFEKNYIYLWTWLGMPIIQMPEDILSVQEIIWKNKPDIIIETGIAWGGSVVFYASILSLYNKHGKVIAIDRVLPQKNIDAIKNYSFKDSMYLLEGDSTDAALFNQVKSLIQPNDKVMMILDSNHTHDHVLAELTLWSPIVTKGQFIVVSDTIVEDIPEHKDRPRPWGKGNNPKTAVRTFLEKNKNFSNDNIYNKRSLASHNYDGYLERL